MCRWAIILFVFPLALFDCKPASHQSNFIGQIRYDYTYESDSLDTDSLSRVKPHKSIFRYDLMDYQSRFIGPDTQTYYYSGELNKCLSETNNQRNYSCEDYSTDARTPDQYKFYETDEKILGQRCSILEFQVGQLWTKYYVSRDIKISPGTWKRHNAYHWRFYGEKADGGVILKLVHKFKHYTMKGIATSLQAEDSSFKALQVGHKLFHEFCNKEKSQ